MSRELDHAPVILNSPGKKSPGKKKLSFHNEEESYIQLYAQQNKHEVVVEITYSGEYPWMVIKHQGKKVHEGAWISSIKRKGELLAPQGSCILTCFSNDSDGMYLEFAQVYAEDLQVDYVLYLPQKYPFLLMACFQNQSLSPQLSLESILPGIAAKDSGKIKKKLDWMQGPETRELKLVNSDYWSILPITTPQFRSQTNGCKVVTVNREVAMISEPGSLPQAHVNVINWQEPSSKLPTTWKQVEVGFNVRPVTGDQAVAWRFRIGKEQFLFYRSFVQMLQPRSAMGLHTNYECVLSILNKNGYQRMLVGIERAN